MNTGIRVFELLNDEDYDWKGVTIKLSKGDTFFGGVISGYPAQIEYQTVRSGLRIWFMKEDVEGNPKRFRELFPDTEHVAPQPEQWKEGDYAVDPTGVMCKITTIPMDSFKPHVQYIDGQCCKNWHAYDLRRPTDADWWVDLGDGVKVMFQYTITGSIAMKVMHHDDFTTTIVLIPDIGESIARRLGCFIKPKEPK